MLKSIRLQNFFSFQDCTVNLEKGVTVLVGINGSGKSNLFKAVKLLTEGMDGKFSSLINTEFGGIDKVWFKGRDPHFNGEIALTYAFLPSVFHNLTLTEVESVDYYLNIFDFFPYPRFVLGDEQVSYKLENQNLPRLIFDRVQQNKYKVIDYFSKVAIEDAPIFECKKDTELALPDAVAQYMDLKDIKWSIEDINTYTNIDVTTESKIRVSNIPTDKKMLLTDGSNLAQLLNTLKNKNKTAFDQINDSLQKVNQHFKGIGIDMNSSNRVELLIQETFNESIHATHISDGTLKFLCLMAVLYNPNRGTVVCLDEPELGLHPDMINTLYEAIMYAGETSQVIISTHSAHLLDYFELEQIRVFEKDENNATVVEQYSKEEFEGWKEQYNSGQLWRSGAIGGNRW
jgi:predicted ATPase